MADSISWPQFLPYLAASLIFGYLLGSIPFGVLVTRLAGTADIRAIGSGNIGATNVLRTGRKGLAALTLLGDGVKGTVAVLIAARWGMDAAICAAMGAFLGHLYPVWLRFRGGKGVATYLGILLAFSWIAALAFAGLWLLTAYLVRYSSLSALVAAAATPLVLTVMEQRQLVELFVVLTLLIAISHRSNIRRLLRGEESRIGQTKSGP